MATPRAAMPSDWADITVAEPDIRMAASRTISILSPGRSGTLSPTLALPIPAAAPMLGANAGRCPYGGPGPYPGVCRYTRSGLRVMSVSASNRCRSAAPALNPWSTASQRAARR